MKENKNFDLYLSIGEHMGKYNTFKSVNLDLYLSIKEHMNIVGSYTFRQNDVLSTDYTKVWDMISWEDFKSLDDNTTPKLYSHDIAKELSEQFFAKFHTSDDITKNTFWMETPIYDFDNIVDGYKIHQMFLKCGMVDSEGFHYVRATAQVFTKQEKGKGKGKIRKENAFIYHFFIKDEFMD